MSETPTVEPAAPVPAEPPAPGDADAAPATAAGASRLTQLFRMLAGYPVTIVVLGLVLLVGLATGALWRHFSDDNTLFAGAGYGVPALRAARPWTFLSGGLFVPTLILLYLPVLIMFAAVLGAYEHRAGHARAAAMVVLGQVLGTALTAAALAPFESGGWAWASELARGVDVGIDTAMFAVLGALTYHLQPVWRTRVRAAVTAYVVAMVLNTGWLWDVEHLIGWLVGLVLGPIIMGRAPRAPKLNFGRRTQRAVVALIVAMFALSNLIEACFPGNGGPLRATGEGYDSGGVTLALVLTSILWLILADGLRRGQRVAWLLTTGVTALAFVSLFAVEPSAERTADLVLVGAQLLLLLVTFQAFTARPERRTVLNAGRRLGKVVFFLFLYTAVGFAALQDDFTPQANPADMVGEFATRLFFSTTHTIEPATTAARLFVNSIGAVWLIAIVVTIIGLVYASRQARPEPEQDTKIRELLRNSPPSSIEWMLTWEGNTVWMSPDGTTGIGYRVVGSVALALADPIGPLDRRRDALIAFDKYCFDRGWIPCLFGANHATAEFVADVGWKAHQIGEDSVVALPDLEFKGKAWQDIRTAINKAGKQDIRMEVVHWADATPVITDQLRAISSGWVSDKSLPEMGFTLGSLKEVDDPDVRLHLAIAADGTIEGFTSWMPVSDSGAVVGWTIDLMRRRDEGFRPVMEFLIGESAMKFKEEGYQFISLSTAPLATAPEHVDESGDQRVLQTLLDFLGEQLEPYYGFRSLLAFKAKFKPEFRQIYLVFPDETALGEIGMAVSRAYMPDATLFDWIKISKDMMFPDHADEAHAPAPA